ncbi:thiamine-phosphate kinase [Vibrio gazogenes]|uniref:Thiamine-monophosphate kinase n=1 Tax=Vibrio gazogenes TaxID=687 RepID=A0A1Z2SD68_VIBGA|nr:thiamine-phosphate kinase [Vibrio gazogenes]ASA55105.1 thiamine-phosphate kinase [Vibrio gazogenes]
MTGEFRLIDRFFKQRQTQRKDVQLGIGDDCAIVKVPEQVRLAISTDTMVSGTHFLPEADPAWIAHKALVSNLSDLAAMGATPAWCTLALTLPETDSVWLSRFCDAFFELASYYNIQLIGGDTTRGPLSITLTVHGFVPETQALTRNGAKVGDWIYVTGTLGDSKAGLELILSAEQTLDDVSRELEKRHYFATPRILAGQSLLKQASAAIDISDGFISDIQHILTGSGVGASIDVSRLPISEALLQYVGGDMVKAQQYALTSGEEYELCFTVPGENQGSLVSALSHCDTPLTCIGQIRSQGQWELHHAGNPLSWELAGYDHFQQEK